jgi:hypothetical protein
MKRLSHIGVITLLLTVNWGAVLAAASCPRAQGHACCHAKSSAHEHGMSPTHDGMATGGMGNMAALSDDDGNVEALDQPPESCRHCMSHPGVPVTAVVSSAQGQSARELSAAPTTTLKTSAAHPSSFAPPVVSRQHAPPGASTSRHVLISVFLI